MPGGMLDYIPGEFTDRIDRERSFVNMVTNPSTHEEDPVVLVAWRDEPGGQEISERDRTAVTRRLQEAGATIVSHSPHA